MENVNPEVTVVVPAFNYAEFLGATLESVRSQTFRNLNCIVVDDGSTDETRSVADAFVANDARFRYERQENRGLAAARNLGLSLATGKYVQFLDADDLIASEKLEAQVQILETGGIDVSYSNFYTFESETGKKIDRYEGQHVGNNPIEDFLFLWERGLTIPIHAAVFRRDLWSHETAFDESLRAKEDWVMWVDLALRGAKFSFIDNDFALYRLHSRNMCRNELAMSREFALAALKIATRIPRDYVSRFVDETSVYIRQNLERWRAANRQEEDGMVNLSSSSSIEKLAEKTSELEAREQVLVLGEQELESKEDALKRRERELDKREADLGGAYQRLKAAGEDLGRDRKDLEAREAKMEEGEKALEMRVLVLENREREASSLEKTIKDGKDFITRAAAALEAERRAISTCGADLRAARGEVVDERRRIAEFRERLSDEMARLASEKADLEARFAQGLDQNEELRRAIESMQSSKIWRLGQLYWTLRYRLGFGR